MKTSARTPFLLSLMISAVLFACLALAANVKQPQAIMLSAASYTTGEGGPAIVIVTRSGGAGAATINYATANGTATAGSDYTAASGALIFAAGETSKALAIAISNETQIEPNETFSFTLSNPGGAALGAPGAATVTIVDDDTPAIAGQWGPVIDWPVVPIHIHLLPNGKVLFWDRHDHALGWDGTPRIWDPQTGAFTTLAAPDYDVFCSGHSFLADGKLLVTGGHISLPPPLDSGVGEDKTSLFDPQTNLWTRLPPMNAGRWYPSNVTLANGDVLTLGGTMRIGSTNTVSVNPLPQVWQTARNTWRNLTGALQRDPPDWADYYPFLYLAPNGRVFCAGPQQEARYLDTNGAGAWTNVAKNSVPYRDYGTSVMYDDGKVLIVGGNPRDPDDKPPPNDKPTILPSDSAEVINLAAARPAWRAAPAPAVGRRHHNATLLPDGKVFITGGSALPGFNNPAGAVFFAEQWDPESERWQTLASYTRYRGYHSNALLLPDGRVLIGGGGHPDPPNFPPQTNIEIYSPPYLFKGARPTITSAPAQVRYGQSFFVQTPDGADIDNVNWLRLGSVTHAFNQNQRINRLNFAATAGGLNVTAPVNPNLCPPGHYLLFILNRSGVPSIARVVQLPPSACDYAIAPTSRSFDAAGGGGAIAVTASNNCGWNAVSNDDWITVTSGANGVDAGAVGYTVAPNPGPAREGAISAAGQTLIITQSGSKITFSATSAGFFVGNFAEFKRDEEILYRQSGVAGRGFNVAAIDRCTGQLREPAQNFDTWGSRDTGAAHNRLRDYLQSLPNGALLLIAVGDEAGLTQFDNCAPLDATYVSNLYQTLEALGSRQIRNYCYRDSWALITVKGASTALAEQLNHNGQATAQTMITAPLTIIPAPPLPDGRVGAQYRQTLTTVGATGSVVFSLSAGALPGGLALTASGVLSGAPTTAGAFPFTIRATDANGCAATRSYTLTINNNVVVSVSAASFNGAELASESIVAVFGVGLATTTQAAISLPLPTTLAGTTVKVRDSAGMTRDAPLFFVSPTQVNYLMPVGTAVGAATVTITSGDGAVSIGVAQIATVAPGLFSANGNGQGVAAGVALRVKDGAQSYEPIVEFNEAQNRFVAKPIDLGPATDQVFLILYGTGFRNRSSLAAVTCKIGGGDAPVLFAGAAPGFAGLDQINVGPLPRSLAGRGEVDVVVTADSKATNTVRIAITAVFR